MKKVSLVVLHFTNKEFTDQCLDSVRKLKTKDFKLETIVVNNNPKEDLKDLEKKFGDFIFLETRNNLGFAGGNNAGIRRALEEGADWVFVVNNDTIFDKDLVVQLFKAGEKDEKVGILSPKIYFAPGYEFHRERYKPNERGKVIWYAGGVMDWQNLLASHRGVDEVDKGQYDEQTETSFISGCAMFIKREVFEKIGLLDERYFLYLEDNDFCQRAKRAGFKLLYVPKAKLWHANAASSAVGGPLHDYYLARNRLLFGIKYAPLRTKLALIRESLRLLLSGRKWQKRGIRDFYFAVAGEVTRNKLAYLGRLGKGSYET